MRDLKTTADLIEECFVEAVPALIGQMAAITAELDEKIKAGKGGQVKDMSIAWGVMADKLLVVHKALKDLAASGGDEIEEGWEDVRIDYSASKHADRDGVGAEAGRDHPGSDKGRGGRRRATVR